MGKRTIRIPQGKILEQLETLPGQFVQAVMLDGKTHAGTVLAASKDSILIEDQNAGWTSRKRHQHKLPTAEIMYLAIESVSSW